MVTQQRQMDEPTDMADGAHTGGLGIGTLLFAAACGIGLGMLTAPEAGRQSRKRLRRGLASLGGEMAGRWETMSERARGRGMWGQRGIGGNIHRRLHQIQNAAEERWHDAESRLADLESRLERFGETDTEVREGRSALNTTLGAAAGAGLMYFLIAENAAPARARVQEVASDLRQQATDRWQQFRRHRAETSTSASTYANEDEQ